MTSDRIARDYLHRARIRRKALDTLVSAGGHADAVRESQEVVELILKGALRFIGVDPPKRHDVRAMLEVFIDRFPQEWRHAMRDLADAAAELVRLRAQAFYGDEETLTPASELFGLEDAERAIAVVDRLLGMYGRLLGADR